MRVTPVSKEVADAGGGGEPLKPGDYDFIIAAAQETISKAGNAMTKLTLHVFGRDGQKRTVFDYIISSEAAAWKARHMMESINMVRRYEQGEIEPHEIEGKPGRCRIKLKPASGDYPAQNSVEDYLVAEVAGAGRPMATKAAAARAGDDLNDDIPF